MKKIGKQSQLERENEVKVQMVRENVALRNYGDLVTDVLLNTVYKGTSHYVELN